MVDPENVTGLLQARDKCKSKFLETFPDYEKLLEGKWRSEFRGHVRLINDYEASGLSEL